MATGIQEGWGAVDTVLAEQERKRAEMAKGKHFRFWMNKGESKTVIFLDGKPGAVVKEHNIKLNGKWGNTFTCLGEFDEPCPLCKTGDRPSDVGFFSVIDLTEFTDKNQVKRSATVKVFPAKSKVLEQLRVFSTKLKADGGIGLMKFDISRSNGENSPATGDLFLPMGRVTEADALALINANRGVDKDGKPRPPLASLADARPKWKEYLAPRDAAELQTILGQKQAEPEPEDTADLDFD